MKDMEFKNNGKMFRSAEWLNQERRKQLEKHGYSAEKDMTENKDGQLAEAAICYLADTLPSYDGQMLKYPWDTDTFKSSGRLDGLIKAGALVLAEIDRVYAESVSLIVASIDTHAWTRDGLSVHIPADMFRLFMDTVEYAFGRYRFGDTDDTGNGDMRLYGFDRFLKERCRMSDAFIHKMFD